MGIVGGGLRAGGDLGKVLASGRGGASPECGEVFQTDVRGRGWPEEAQGARGADWAAGGVHRRRGSAWASGSDGEGSDLRKGVRDAEVNPRSCNILGPTALGFRHQAHDL